MNAKLKALAKFLEADVIEFEATPYDADTFEHDSGEYRVLTDAEADKAAREYILDTLWAFRAEFIAAHANTRLDDAAIKALSKMQGELCESANPLVRALIRDIDQFVDDAIKADGRGHFLASYDFEEIEVFANGTIYFIYRVN